jgi:hypothetical protein
MNGNICAVSNLKVGTFEYFSNVCSFPAYVGEGKPIFVLVCLDLNQLCISYWFWGFSLVGLDNNCCIECCE